MTRKMCYQCSLGCICVVESGFEAVFRRLDAQGAFCLNCGRCFVARRQTPNSPLDSVKDVWYVAGACQRVRDLIYGWFDWLTTCPVCVGSLPDQNNEYRAIRNDGAPGQWWRARMDYEVSEKEKKLIEYPVLLRWRTSTSGRVRNRVEVEWNGSGYQHIGGKTKGEKNGQL